MTHYVSNQIQLYRYVIEHQGRLLFEYSEVQSLTFNPPVLPSNSEPKNDHGIPFELLIFSILILLAMTFIAYYFGKKRGQQEKGKEPISNNDSPSLNKFKLLKKLDMVHRQSTKDTSSPSSNDNSSGTKPEKPELDNIGSDKLDNDAENNKIALLKSPERPSSPVLFTQTSEIPVPMVSRSLHSGSSTKSEEENRVALRGSVALTESNTDLTKFNIRVKQSIDPVSNVSPAHPELMKEAIELHTDSTQVKEKEVEFGVTFQIVNGFLQKTETVTKTTKYIPGAKDPEDNALKLKEVTEKYKNGDNSFKGIFKYVPEEKLTIVPPQLAKIVETPRIDDAVEYSFHYGGCIEEVSSKEQSSKQEASSKAIPQSPSAIRLQNLIENDDFPHETGKFNKIFKNAELIGEGSFGEVYKVLHKLDGKTYAVKRVKLRLRKLEDLQTQSKQFREVFAMTDLHHPNIVRYSTCWVEIEVEKEKEKFGKNVNHRNSIKESKWESESEIVEDEADHSDEEPKSSGVGRSRARSSASGFVWDDGDAEESLSTDNLTLRRVKSEKKPQKMVIRSLSRTFLKEELEASSSMSNTSKAGYDDALSGVKLSLYIQMEFCSGENLRNYLDDQKRVCCQEKELKMFKKLVEGVNAIHQRGILHRDLKPANIFLDGSENVKIGDFGLASLDYTEEYKGISANIRKGERCLSMKVGTPMYTSPEQESGGRYNQKTDVYSLGLILFEMLESFPTMHERYQSFNRLRREHDLPDKFKERFPRESEVIMMMTKFKPEDRPSTEDLISYIEKIIKDAKNEVKFGPRTLSQVD